MQVTVFFHGKKTMEAHCADEAVDEVYQALSDLGAEFNIDAEEGD